MLEGGAGEVWVEILETGLGAEGGQADMSNIGAS